jgi:glycosyltransferase involved in cell wall biosynthesis
MKNVLFVAYRFPPCGGTPVQRPLKFVKYLPEFGYRPIVLTGDNSDPRLARDPDLLKELADTIIYACTGNEHLVVHLPRKLGLSAIMSLGLRPDSGILAWVPIALRAARAIAREHPIHAIYTTVGPFSSALLGARLRQLWNVPWILDYRDPWTDGYQQMWPSKLHYWYECRQERCALTHADAIVVVTPTMRDMLVRRYPQFAPKIHVICNGYDSTDISTMGRSNNEGRLHLAYAGAIFDHRADLGHHQLNRLIRLGIEFLSYRLGKADYKTHSPYYLFHALHKLLDERPEWRDAIRLSIVGHIKQGNVELARELGLDDIVHHVGFLPHAECVQYVNQCDALVLLMQSPPPGHRSYIHSAKTFEYLAMRKPILGLLPEGDAADLLSRAGSGWCVDPRDIDAIKCRLQDMVERKQAGTLSIAPDTDFIAQFDRRELTRQLAALFASPIHR